MPVERDRPGRPPHRDYPRPGTPAPHALEDSGEILPPPIPHESNLGGDTPLHDVLDRVGSRVGRLSDRDVEIVTQIFEHVNRGRKRQADDTMELEQKVAKVPGLDRGALLADMPSWQPFKSDRERLGKLEEAVGLWQAVVRGLKRWVFTSGAGVLLALATALYSCGVKSGLSKAAEARAVEQARALVEATAKNNSQDVEIGALRAVLLTRFHNTNGD